MPSLESMHVGIIMNRWQFERSQAQDDATRERNRKRRAHYRKMRHRATGRSERLQAVHQQQMAMRSYCPGVIAFAVLYG
jgi:hypothetical protein